MYCVNASCDYLGSARFEEDAHLETRLSKPHSRSGSLQKVTGMSHGQAPHRWFGCGH